MMKRMIAVWAMLWAGATLGNNYDQVFEQHASADAQSFFSARADQDDDDHLARYYLGRLAMQQQEFEDAIDWFDEAIDEFDGDHRYHFWYANAHVAIVGDVNVFKQGIYAKRIRTSYQRAVELKPDDIESLQGLFGFYLSAPGIAGGDLDRAREVASTLRGLDEARGWEAEAGVLLREEKPDQALAAYGKAVDADPENALIRYRYAAFLINREQVDEGVQQIDVALPKVTGEDAERQTQLLSYQLGKAAAISGRYLDRGQTALEGYLKGEVSDGMPGADWAQFRLAQIDLHRGNRDSALSNMRSLKKRTDDDQLQDRIDAALKAAQS